MAKMGHSTASAATLAKDAKVDPPLMSMATEIEDVVPRY